MNERRSLLSYQSIKNLLPSELTMVNYLEGYGSYIVTDIEDITLNDEFEMSIVVTDKTSGWIWGIKENTSYAFMINIKGDLGNLGGTIHFMWGSAVIDTGVIANIGDSYTFKTIINGNNLDFYMNDELYGSVPRTFHNFSAGKKTHAIFGLRYGLDDNVGPMRRCRFKLFKYYRDGELITNFLPCVNASNKPCMYDKTNKKIFYGTGMGGLSYG